MKRLIPPLQESHAPIDLWQSVAQQPSSLRVLIKKTRCKSGYVLQKLWTRLFQRGEEHKAHFTNWKP